MFTSKDLHIAVIGLGYVGLPLAVEFGKKYKVLGFDIDSERVGELKEARDSTLELSEAELREAEGLYFTSDPEDLASANIYIVTVPTPVDIHKTPDLSLIVTASRIIGRVLKKQDIVIYESTVYPGATEEVCIPVLEEVSGLVFNRDFYVGYSPERVSPGDKRRRLQDVTKVVSGSTDQLRDFLAELYGKIITAGIHKAESIKVAEAAKVIENTQRDVNIALINELALIFNKMNIDTEAVLTAAETKWNFISFRPGLVGGHCIGVDPYYLTYKAQAIGYHPAVILAGRRINDSMGFYVAASLLKAMMKKGIYASGARVLIMGLSFKEDCPDLRNTRVVDIVHELKEYGVRVDVYDPWVCPEEAEREYGIKLIAKPESSSYEGIVIAVAHRQFKEMGAPAIRALGKKRHILYDIKYILAADESDLRL